MLIALKRRDARRRYRELPGLIMQRKLNIVRGEKNDKEDMAAACTAGVPQEKQNISCQTTRI